MSQGPTQAQLKSEVARFWATELRFPTNYSDRKTWEYVWCLQALAVRGMLAPGRCGLGFAVGQEPISAYLAARGVRVLATDAPAGVADDQWAESNQYAQCLSDLDRHGLCDPEALRERVRFRPVDMNRIDPDLKDFDFCWSLCAIEHLGDFERLKAFLFASLGTIRVGGWSVHSGELFCGPHWQAPPERGDTIHPRAEQYVELVRELRAAGHHVEPLNFNLGETLVDQYVDFPPYGDRHLKLAYRGVDTTSFGIIVQRGAPC